MICLLVFPSYTVVPLAQCGVIDGWDTSTSTSPPQPILIPTQVRRVRLICQQSNAHVVNKASKDVAPCLLFDRSQSKPETIQSLPVGDQQIDGASGRRRRRHSDVVVVDVNGREKVFYEALMYEVLCKTKTADSEESSKKRGAI